MSENNTAPQQQQQQQRLPQVTPAIFEAVNQLDGFIQKAPLTRTEHQTAFQPLQNVLRHIEALEGQVAAAGQAAAAASR